LQVRGVSQAYLDTAQTINMPQYVTIDFNVQYQWDKDIMTLTANVINLLANQG
jgi:outer membrane receptor protein involved in Fe transport